MPSRDRELESEAGFGGFPSAEASQSYPIGSTWSGFHESWFQCQTEQSMKRYPIFSRSYFEREFPHIQRLTDFCGKPSSVLLTLDEGFRIELREYQLCPSGLRIEASSGPYLIPFRNIQSIQVIPKKKIQKKSPSHN